MNGCCYTLTRSTTSSYSLKALFGVHFLNVENLDRVILLLLYVLQWRRMTLYWVVYMSLQYQIHVFWVFCVSDVINHSDSSESK